MEDIEPIKEKAQNYWFSVFFFPFYFVLILWLAKVAEIVFKLPLRNFGVIPRDLEGLPGIFLSVFIHHDFEHLISNTFPILLLSCALFYFYKPIAYRIFFLSILLSGLGTWMIGRESVHIGASGLVYSLAFFIFFSGLIRKHTELMAVSLLVVFLYGGLIWFMLPVVKSEISWEGHLSGAFAGMILALTHRKKGPQRKVYEWENENPDETYPDEAIPGDPDQTRTEGPRIVYIYREKEPERETGRDQQSESGEGTETNEQDQKP